ncbi:MAG TPA: IPT/TIG domain-containing protein [Longimicrobiales bacterium]|nr:IPT/TIG domain-containing protein [Longimicrobiales bacterium]
MRSTRWAMGALTLAALAGCDGGSTEPEPADRVIAIQGGDAQVAVIGQEAIEPLQVVVSDAATEEPVVDATVTWEVVAGTGAGVSPATTRTDSSGVASTRLTLGPDPGIYQVRASTPGMVGTPPVFSVRAVASAPVLTSIEPAAAAVGDTVTLTGDDFSPTPEENRVLFAGVRALVVSATATRIRAVVPPCLPSRSVSVVVMLGPLSSAPLSLSVQGDGQGPLALEPGEVATVTEPGEVGCLRLPESPTGSEYLVIVQNASEAAGSELFYRLVGVTGQGGTATVRAEAETEAAHAHEVPVALAWEAHVRARERAIPRSRALRAPTGDELALLTRVPVVGERKKFNVLNKEDRFTEITAEVQHVSQRAVFYLDLNAPTGGFTSADFQRFGALFDDPIYPTDVRVFGAPSDVDANERITILFTPVVNELTPKGSRGFVAGFFFAWDLTTNAGSNQAEIFYSVVPDPNGQFGDARTVTRILEVVPPVLAHEFQHMIHYHQKVRLRGGSQEALWLSEGLAHMAEDLVGEEFLRRGDVESAVDFKQDNFARAALYLQRPDTVSLLAIKQPGNLGERGAAWLFLLHLMGHYGGEDLITRLTQTTRSSVSNVRAETGQSWMRLLSDWVVANYADDLAALAGTALESRFTYPQVNLRQVLGGRSSGYPLQPPLQSFQDFVMADTLPASSPDYLLLRVTSTTPRPLNLSFASGSGAGFPAGARPQLTVLRVR